MMIYIGDETLRRVIEFAEVSAMELAENPENMKDSAEIVADIAYVKSNMRPGGDYVAETFLKNVFEEREYQDSVWGREHDKHHSMRDWVAFITAYLGRAVKGDEGWNPDKQNRDNFYVNMVRVAALALSAIEAVADD